MSGAHARPELLASPDWLAENLGRPELRILDVRWRPDGAGGVVFNAGHVPDATYLDWRAALTDTDAPDGTLLLAPPDQVAAALAGAGIGNGTTVVVYDDTASLLRGADVVEPARLRPGLRADPRRRVRGLARLGPARLATPSRSPTARTFTPRAQLRLRLTTSDAESLVGSPDALFLDARTPAEYRGFAGSGRRLGPHPGRGQPPRRRDDRAGHGPLPRRRRPARAPERPPASSRARRVVCYDGTGVGAAKLAFVLALMGHDDVAVYDGGWAEWGNRLDLPIER